VHQQQSRHQSLMASSNIAAARQAAEEDLRRGRQTTCTMPFLPAWSAPHSPTPHLTTGGALTSPHASFHYWIGSALFFLLLSNACHYFIH
jgi:hypothetical protein